MAVFLPRPGRH